MTSTIILLKLLMSCNNLLFCHYDGQKIEKIVLLLMRYEDQRNRFVTIEI